MKKTTIKLDLDTIYSDGMDSACEFLDADDDNICGTIEVTDEWIQTMKKVHAGMSELAKTLSPVQITSVHLDYVPGYETDFMLADTDDRPELYSFILGDNGYVTFRFATHYSENMFHVDIGNLESIAAAMKEEQEDG